MLNQLGRFAFQSRARQAVLLLSSLFLASLIGCENTALDPAKYPEKPITIICPWAAGGGTDQLSRFVAEQLQQRLDNPVIVVNKEGGSGAVGHSEVARADADGYTIGMITAELSTMHQMGISDLTFRDYKCLMQLNGDAAAVIVKKDAPWKNLPEFLDFIRAHPKEVKMSGTATGGLWDLARAGMLREADIPVESVIWVPTKGAAPSIVKLIGGHIDAVCCSLPEAAAQIAEGEFRAIAVFSAERLSEFPEIPTAKEQGLNWVAVGWRGLALPKDTPAVIVDRLEKHLAEIAQSEEFLGFMKKTGFGVIVKGPKEFTEFLELQETQWKPVIEAAGLAKP